MKTGIFLIILGLFIWLLNIGLFSFWNWKRDWPWILIILGTLSITSWLKRKLNQTKIYKKEKYKKQKIKEILDKIEKGEISIEEALERIKKQ